jgi:hypothetical protein
MGALMPSWPMSVSPFEDASFVSFPRHTPAPANYYDWKRMNRSFTDMAATRSQSGNLTTDGPAEQVLGRGVTANFFSVLGVLPLLGRSFTDDEDRSAGGSDAGAQGGTNRPAESMDR